jgi:arylsulfatase A-like enzyme
MFATCCVCSPSRGSLLTGRYPQSNGLAGLAGPTWDYELNDPREHLSHVMRENGYHTVFCGLQHETADISTLGFDDDTCAHEHIVPEGVMDEHRCAMTTAENAAAFIEGPRAKEQPFFMQVGFFETHTPYLWGGCEADATEDLHLPEYTQASLDDTWRGIELRPHVAGLQASVRMVDRGVEKILEALESSGLKDDTLLLFTVDHGPELPRAKWTLHDAGLRVAFILRWPGGGFDGGRVCDGFLSNVDFLPTLAEITGIDVPDNIEGTSFAHLLEAGSERKPSNREEAFAMFLYSGEYCVRTQQHKLIAQFTDEEDSIRLFDLQADPLELNDLSDDPVYADTRTQLTKRLRDWLAAVNDPLSERLPE